MTTLFRNTTHISDFSMRSPVYLFLCVANAKAATTGTGSITPHNDSEKPSWFPKFWTSKKEITPPAPVTPQAQIYRAEWSCTQKGDETTWVSNRRIRTTQRSVTFFGEVACTHPSPQNDEALNKMFDDGQPPTKGDKLDCHADEAHDSPHDGQLNEDQNYNGDHMSAAGKGQPIVIITSPEGWKNGDDACKKAKEFHSENNSWKCKNQGSNKAIYTNAEYGKVTFEDLSCVNLPITVKLKELFTPDDTVCDETKLMRYICQTTTTTEGDSSYNGDGNSNHHHQVFKAEIEPLNKKYMIKEGCDKAKVYHDHLIKLLHKTLEH